MPAAASPVVRLKWMPPYATLPGNTAGQITFWSYSNQQLRPVYERGYYQHAGFQHSL
jgi:hypothetical protein